MVVSALETFLWAGYPYIAIFVFLAGVIMRFDRDPYGWTSKSSEILEKRMLGIGSLLFHWGFIVVFIGHVFGLLVPVSFYNSLGITTEEYHTLAFYLGTAAGVISIIGLLILLVRRIINPRVRATSTFDDYFTLIVLLIIMGVGIFTTDVYTLTSGPYDYRHTIAVWVRSLFTLQPDVAVMASAPLSFQIHVLLGLFFFAVFPFTRLVHILSLPIPYLWRRYIVYRPLTPRLASKRQS